MENSFTEDQLEMGYDMVYGDSITPELDNMLDVVVNRSILMGQTEYTRDQLLNLLNLLEPFEYGEYSMLELSQLAVGLGKISRKLDLTGSAATPAVLRHLQGTIKYSLEVLEQGCKVHLIEGVDSYGRIIVADLDLLYSDNDTFYKCDYTNKQVGTTRRLSFSEATGKYDKLTALDSVPGEPIVCTVSVPTFLFNGPVTCNTYADSPREDDFKFADKIIQDVRDLSWSEAEMCLMEYAGAVKEVSLKHGFIESSRKIVTDEEAASLIKLGRVNDPYSARMHDEFRKSLKKSSDKYFVSDDFDRILSNAPKKLCPMPPFSRGYCHKDPFERCKDLIRLVTEERGLEPLLFWKLVSNCSEDFISGADIATGNELDYHVMVNAQMKRAKAKDGTLMKAVILQFGDGNSWTSMKEVLPELDKSTHMNPEMLELSLNEEWKISSKQSHGSLMLDDIDIMVDDCSHVGESGAKIRAMMKKVLQLWGKTRVMTQLSQLQQITMAILAGVRKSRQVKGRKGGVKISGSRSRIALGLDCISDAKAVVAYNLGPLDMSDIKDVNYMVLADFDATSPYTRCTHQCSSRLLSMSRAMMDWNMTLTHKSLSWMSMVYENFMATHVKTEKPVLPRLPLYLMFINSNKFSQAAETVRYLFVNGISLSSGPGELLKKIQWYHPKTELEMLYMCRMFKMTNVLSLAKSHQLTKLLRVDLSTSVGSGLQSKFTLREWNIAMPDDDQTAMNEQSVFNSFYICKALSIQRYNKLTSEAMVVMKQLDAREKYLSYKRENYPHEGRNRSLSTPFVQMVAELNLSDDPGKPFSPDPVVVALGTIATMLRLKSVNDLSVGQTMDRVYKMDELAWQMNLAEVMNNRGSVANVGPNGVIKTAFQTRDGKPCKVTQNSKCYETILQSVSDMVDNVIPAPTCNWVNASVPTIVNNKVPNLDNIRIAADKLWPLVYYFSEQHAACVSKMVHKDQIGSREIAVLNSAARCMCRYLENFARAIRDQETKSGLRTNLIEKADKHDVIMRTLSKSNIDRKSGRTVVYDSADCSKWGPSMLMHVLYQVVACRLSQLNHRKTLRNICALFGNKVFKIPDELYLHGHEFTGQNDIRRLAHQRLKSMSSEMGNYDQQLIYLEESMHQGICGCSSSVLGADAHNLSDFVTAYNHRDVSVRTVTHLTSDDYSRVISWEGDEGLFSLGKQLLSEHYNVLQHCGIQRNLEKSGLSTSYWEFNSEFFCPTGEIKPDIKSRLSYIDICPSTDLYDVALSAMTNSVEFLRSEGSLLGATWTFVLRNHLAMLQNQSRKLWTQLGQSLYEVPLEYGGLIRPNPLKAAVSSQFLPLLDNYKNPDCPDAQVTLTTMLRNQSLSPELITIDEKHQLKVPSLSRSGTVKLSRRPTRTSRHIREFLNGLLPEDFVEVVNEKRHGSLILALIACARRESSVNYNDGAAINYALSQVSRDRPSFLINTSVKALVSREDLHNLAREHLIVRHEFRDRDYEEIQADSWLKEWSAMEDRLRHMSALSLSSTQRKMMTLRFREVYTYCGFVQERMSEFEGEYKPQLLGGESDIHPWEYIEAKLLLSNKLSNLTRRRQNFRMCLLESDMSKTTWAEKILRSNFAGNCRLEFVITSAETFHQKMLYIPVQLKHLDPNTTCNLRGITVDLLSPQLSALLSSNRVANIDITAFCNYLLVRDNSIMIDHELSQVILANLKLMSQRGRMPLIINPRLLTTSFPETRYHSVGAKSMTMLPLKGVTSTAGREVYKRVGKTYFHYFTFTRDLAPTLEETNDDVVELLDLTSTDSLRVNVSGEMGFSILTPYKTKHIIQIFPQLDISQSTLTAYTAKPLTSLVTELSHLDLYSYVLSPTILDNSVAALLEPTHDEDQMMQESIAQPELLEDIVPDIGSDYSDYSDFGSEVDDYELPDVDDLEPKEESHKSWDDDYDVEDDHYQSESGVCKPSPTVLNVLKAGMVNILPSRMVDNARRATRLRLSEGYRFKLPFQLNEKRYYDDNNKNFVEKILDAIDIDIPPDDRGWARDCFLSTLALYPPVRVVLSSLQEMRRVDLDQSYDDQDW